jgi:hypothetical protein
VIYDYICLLCRVDGTFRESERPKNRHKQERDPAERSEPAKPHH